MKIHGLILIGLWCFGFSVAVCDDQHLKLLLDAESLAEEYRGLGEESDQKRELEKKIQALVRRSFEARQSDQLQQIDQMRAKLDQAEAAIRDRDAIRERIVTRKVEDLLSGQPADWKTTPESDAEFFDVIGVGDIVAIYLEGVLPYNRPKESPAGPQVNLLRSGRLVMGFPFTVGYDGAITLPIVGPVVISGLTVREAEKLIGKTYVDQDVLRPEKALPTLTLVPKEEAVFRSAGDVKVVQEISEQREITPNVGAAVASFEDSYGRLDKARELVSQIRDKENEIDYDENIIKRWQNEGRNEIEIANRKRSIDRLKKVISTALFRLELERDYIADVIVQLEADLKAKQILLQQSQGDLERSDQLFRSGVATANGRSEAQTQYEKARGEHDNANLKLSRYQKIADRWQVIVGDLLDESADSEQSVDEGGGR